MKTKYLKLKKWFLDLFFTFNEKRSVFDIFINLYCARQNYLLINLWYINRDCYLYGQVLNINYLRLSVDISYYIADGCSECETIKLRDIFSVFATNGKIENNKIGKVYTNKNYYCKSIIKNIKKRINKKWGKLKW